MGSVEFRFPRCSVTYQIVMVMAVPADGAIEFARMLYFRPSTARVRVKPMMAAFAVEYYRQNSQSEKSLDH